jgi:hypothetical protein
VIQIEPRDGGLVFWNETLANLASLPSGSKMIIPSIPAGESRKIQIAAILPSGVGNAYQGKSTSSFSFVMGNESTDQPEPTSSPSPPPVLGATSTATGTTSRTTDSVIGESGEMEDQSEIGEDGESILGTTSDGAKGATTEANDLCFWWIVVLVILIAFLVIYHRYIKEDRPIFWWLWPVVMAAVLFFVQMIFDRYYEPTIFCRWFWALEAGVLVIYYIFENHSESKKEEK